MKKHILSVLTIFTLLIVSCSKDDEPTTQVATVELNSEVNDFVWKAMNHWYFWQEDVSNLADTKDDEVDEYHSFLNGYTDNEDLFNDLVNTSLDDFSWYIDNVEEQLNSFRGISESYGIGLPSNRVRVQEGSDDIVIFVAYVTPGSPADNAGIERGDLIYKIDGSILNTNNASLINNLFREPSITIGLASFENGSLNPKGEDKSLNAVVLSQNPVHYSSVIEEDGKKIGYLVYNGFRGTFHEELNAVFTNFKSQNIDELVLDLRYNRGGSVLTSAYLSSMIEGTKADGQPFASLTYNAKRNPQNESIFRFRDEAALFDKQTGKFTETFIPISRLENLGRVYVLTSRNTASASEMIINGLRPSMDVIVVGTTTTGKNEGSFTVVDAPARGDFQVYEDLDNRNPNHTIGMQPIVFQIFNSLGQSDYAEGFEPNIAVDELNFTANILPFGDTNEVLLRAALNNISVATKVIQIPLTKVEKLDKIKQKKFSDAMYIMPGEKGFN